MIGEEVRRRREVLGLTGAQLAARAGLAPSAVSQIETGKRTPSSASVIKLAAALGVEAGELFPKPQAPQPSLEDAARSDDASQEALAVLYRELARHGQWIVRQSLEHGSSKALAKEAAKFDEVGMLLGKIKGTRSIFGHDSDELAEAVDDYQDAAGRIGRLLEQDVDHPEKAREANWVREARKLKAQKEREMEERRADAS